MTDTARSDVTPPNDAEARDLAHELDCITDEELQALGHLKPSTTEAWRKRGTGPAYLLFGNRVLYPKKGLREHLESLVRQRNLNVGSQL